MIHAERLFAHIIPGSGERAGAASHADVPKLAASALPFQVSRIAQFVENCRVLPDLGEVLLAKVSGECGKVSAREHFALV